MEDIPSLGLSDEEATWCEGCQRRQKIIDQHEQEKSLNYKTLKQKIISTDLLIKKFRTKCEEYDQQSKMLEDVTRKLERAKRDTETLDNQLQNFLQQMEPMRNENNSLKTVINKKDKEIELWKNKVDAADNLRVQYEAYGLENDTLRSKVDKYEKERKSFDRKLDTIETSKQKQEKDMHSLKEINKTIKREKNSLEKKLGKAVQLHEKHLDRLQQNDIMTKYDKRLRNSLVKQHQCSDDEFNDHTPFTSSDHTPFTSSDHGFVKQKAEDVILKDIDLDLIFTMSPIVNPMSPLPPTPQSNSFEEDSDDPSDDCDMLDVPDTDVLELEKLLTSDKMQSTSNDTGTLVAEIPDNCENSATINKTLTEYPITPLPVMQPVDTTDHNNPLTSILYNMEDPISNLETHKLLPIQNKSELVSDAYVDNLEEPSLTKNNCSIIPSQFDLSASLVTEGVTIHDLQDNLHSVTLQQQRSPEPNLISTGQMQTQLQAVKQDLKVPVKHISTDEHVFPEENKSSCEEKYCSDVLPYQNETTIEDKSQIVISSQIKQTQYTGTFTGDSPDIIFTQTIPQDNSVQPHILPVPKAKDSVPSTKPEPTMVNDTTSSLVMDTSSNVDMKPHHLDKPLKLPSIGTLNTSMNLLTVVQSTNLIKAETSRMDGPHINNAHPQTQNEVYPQTQNEVYPRIQYEMHPQIQNEMHPQIQNETHPQIQNAMHPQIQNETHPQIQNETHPQIQNETHPQIQNDMHPQIQNETHPQIHNKEHLHIQNEINLQIQNETHPQIQNETHPQIKNETHPQIKNEIHPEIQNETHPAMQNKEHLQIKNEINLQIQNETHPQIQNKTHPQIKNKTHPQIKNEIHPQIQIEVFTTSSSKHSSVKAEELDNCPAVSQSENYTAVESSIFHDNSNSLSQTGITLTVDQPISHKVCSSREFKQISPKLDNVTFAELSTVPDEVLQNPQCSGLSYDMLSTFSVVIGDSTTKDISQVKRSIDNKPCLSLEHVPKDHLQNIDLNQSQIQDEAPKLSVHSNSDSLIKVENDDEPSLSSLIPDTKRKKRKAKKRKRKESELHAIQGSSSQDCCHGDMDQVNNNMFDSSVPYYAKVVKIPTFSNMLEPSKSFKPVITSQKSTGFTISQNADDKLTCDTFMSDSSKPSCRKRSKTESDILDTILKSSDLASIDSQSKHVQFSHMFDGISMPASPFELLDTCMLNPISPLPPSPEAEQPPSPEAEQPPSPEAEQPPSPEAEQPPSPEAEQPPSPEAEQPPSPEAEQPPFAEQPPSPEVEQPPYVEIEDTCLTSVDDESDLDHIKPWDTQHILLKAAFKPVLQPKRISRLAPVLPTIEQEIHKSVFCAPTPKVHLPTSTISSLPNKDPLNHVVLAESVTPVCSALRRSKRMKSTDTALANVASALNSPMEQDNQHISGSNFLGKQKEMVHETVETVSQNDIDITVQKQKETIPKTANLLKSSHHAVLESITSKNITAIPSKIDDNIVENKIVDTLPTSQTESETSSKCMENDLISLMTNGSVLIDAFIQKYFDVRQLEKWIQLVMIIFNHLKSTKSNLTTRISEDVNSNKTTPDMQTPLLFNTEINLLILLKNICSRWPTCSDMVLLNLLLKSVINGKLNAQPMAAMCRIFIGVCRLKGDLEQARVMAYEVVFHFCACGHECGPILVLAIAGVWPLIFDAEFPAKNIIVPVMEHVTMTTIPELIFTQAKVFKYISELCGWRLDLPLKNNKIVSDKIIHYLKDVTHSKLSDVKGSVFDGIAALKLLYNKENWSFFFTEFVNRHVSSACQKWVFKAENSDITPEYIQSILKVLGDVNLAEKGPEANKINSLTRMYLMPTLNKKSQFTSVSLTAADTIMKLSPLSPQMSCSYLLTWFRKHKNEIPDDVKVRLRCTRQYLLENCNNFNCAEFV